MFTVLTDKRTLNHALLICGACALWLLVSPSAGERRARARIAQQLRASFQTEWEYNVVLTRYRHGLENDPAVLESEARRLGYGRPGERAYPLSKAELRAEQNRLPKSAQPHRIRNLSREITRAIAPALLLIIAGAAAVIFFANLSIEDPTET